MSFYGLVMIFTLLVISFYVTAFLGEISSEESIANAYSIIAERIAGSPGAATMMPSSIIKIITPPN